MSNYQMLGEKTQQKDGQQGILLSSGTGSSGNFFLGPDDQTMPERNIWGI